ncbi:MAG: YraN family protein [Butyrivibrio sp.]|nr:YraN family protein [Butyrivibrio sp.]
MNKRVVGDFYENLACSYIEEQGGKIIERNYRALRGEIDIIAKDGKYLCFIEVKYRRGNHYGHPEAAVDIRKQKQICRISGLYLISKYNSLDLPIRYDVIALSSSNDAVSIRWHKNAFSYI